MGQERLRRLGVKQARLENAATVKSGNSTLSLFFEILRKRVRRDDTTITERPEYDHAGRTIASYHKINDQPEVQMSALYNELGELIEKNLHVTDSGAMQSIDYRNNIRGCSQV